MAGMTTGPDNPSEPQDILRAIKEARETGLSQASGSGFAATPDADNQSTPEQALIDNPSVNVSDQLGMAAFDLAVRGAVSAKFGVQIQNRQFHDEFSMTGGGGTLQEYFEEMFEGSPEEKKKKENEEALRDAVENVQERQREEREREEWGRTRHSYAGVTRTGAEWLELSQKLKKGEPLNQWLIEEMRKNGEQNPEELAELVRLKTEINGTPERYWTEEQKQAAAYLEAHPEAEQKVAEYTKRVADRDMELKASSSAELGGINPQNELANNISAESSISARADLFASAPDLKSHHQAALAATEPLDVETSPDPTPPTLPPRPVQPVIAAAPGGGFAV